MNGVFKSTCSCSSCASLKAHVCKTYHNNKKNRLITSKEAQEEFCLRLLFEVVFGYLPMEAVRPKIWRRMHVEDGHLKRLCILKGIAKSAWII
jgi:hypothetical protein